MIDIKLKVKSFDDNFICKNDIKHSVDKMLVNGICLNKEKNNKSVEEDITEYYKKNNIKVDTKFIKEQEILKKNFDDKYKNENKLGDEELNKSTSPYLSYKKLRSYQKSLKYKKRKYVENVR